MNDGGPAFPFQCQGPTTAPEVYYGMSLRDWFAGHTMASLIAGGIRMVDPIDGEQLFKSPENVARSSYLYADAMLKEREKGYGVEDTLRDFQKRESDCLSIIVRLLGYARLLESSDAQYTATIEQAETLLARLNTTSPGHDPV